MDREKDVTTQNIYMNSELLWGFEVKDSNNNKNVTSTSLCFKQPTKGIV